jgi:hypothetical protein
MTDDTNPLFSFPAVEGKKVTAAFDGGRISSDGGVMHSIPDRRDPWRIASAMSRVISQKLRWRTASTPPKAPTAG